MDWYKQRKFICEISGHSGLSFFDALKSETAGARDVESAFPEALKQPVLRKLQFSTVSRIDNLVDQIYDAFKTDYYPGEQVIVTKGNDRHNGTIRDKATFSEARDGGGRVTRQAFARYIVQTDESETGEGELLAEDVEISRDRKIFTKQMLRSFIKNTVTREAWTGAPWLVKADVARLYHVDGNVPIHLQHAHKIAEKKEKKKAEQQQQHEGSPAGWQGNKLPELKPASKAGRKQLAHSQEHLQEQYRAAWDEYYRQHPQEAFASQQWHAQNVVPLQGHGYPYPPPQLDTPFALPDAQGFPLPQFLPAGKHMGKVIAPPPPPVIKYPIEDMDCPPLTETAPRPTLKFVTRAQISSTTDEDNVISGLHENKVSLLLETWNTLNVYCQVLHLDSFTFDDYVDAMQWTSTEVECELLVETHCAMLKQLVQDAKAGGALQIALPDLPEPDNSDGEDDNKDESHISSPTPEADVPARRTRSSLNKKAIADMERDNGRFESEIESIPHRAKELLADDNTWIDKLRKRDFHNGGWQLILVGLLHQLAGRPRMTDTCVRILSHLVPLDAEASVETVIFQYSNMDINLRAEAMQILCSLFLETKAVKKFLEDMSATMTEYRKKKIEHQRSRKEYIAILRSLHDDRKILAPLERTPTPVPEIEELEDADKTINVEMDDVEDSEDETPTTTRSLRRGQDRAAERKRKRVEEEAERRKKEQELKANANKGSKEYQRVLKAIEKERDKIAIEEEAIEIIDGDLREADSYRTRCLGKDRFCNRYWWFERNAMPFAGLPDSSTADAAYSNGRLWVQGPDDMERIGYIDVADDARNNYFRCFHMTPAERKKKEEGITSLHFATQWGFYDDGESIEQLIEWLDNRGVREIKLKKELITYHDAIIKHMKHRQKYVYSEKTLHSIDDEASEAEDQDFQQQSSRPRKSPPLLEMEEYSSSFSIWPSTCGSSTSSDHQERQSNSQASIWSLRSRQC